MKRFFYNAMAVFFAMSASFAVVSCEEENNDEIPDFTSLKAITTDYTVELTEDYIDFYDVTVTYGFGDSEGTTVTMSSAIWSLDQTFNKEVSELPDRFFCKVTATPKSEVPAIDETKTYHFDSSYNMLVNGLRNDGQTKVLGLSANSQNVPVGGSKMQNLLNKGAKTIVDFVCENK